LAHFGAWYETCKKLNESMPGAIRQGTATAKIKESFMFGWALTFLIIAIIAGIFGFTGVAGTASNIAWILFVVGLVVAVIFALTGRRSRL